MARYDNGNETQRLIVDSAKKLFFEKGVQNTSTHDVAIESHVVRNSVRYYFKTKKDMQRAVSDDILNRLADVTIEKLELEKYYWFVMSFVFWFRFFHDNSFRKYSFEVIGQVDASENDFHFVHEYMHIALGGTLPYDEFLAQNRIALEISGHVQEHLMEYYLDRLETTTFEEAARNELLLSMRLYGISDSLIQARIDDTLQLLPSLDIQKMSEALG